MAVHPSEQRRYQRTMRRLKRTEGRKGIFLPKVIYEPIIVKLEVDPGEGQPVARSEHSTIPEEGEWEPRNTDWRWFGGLVRYLVEKCLVDILAVAEGGNIRVTTVFAGREYVGEARAEGTRGIYDACKAIAIAQAYTYKDLRYRACCPGDVRAQRFYPVEKLDGP